MAVARVWVFVVMVVIAMDGVREDEPREHTN